MLSSLVSAFQNASIRSKLILVFVVAKALPLVLLAWIAWLAASELADNLGNRVDEMASSMRQTITEIGNSVTRDSVDALDNKSRDAIERLTTDTANSLARFLYDRDSDILLASSLPINENSYRLFLENRTRAISTHQAWQLSEDQTEWQPKEREPSMLGAVRAVLEDNDNSFHSRARVDQRHKKIKPLYAEMTFVDLNGEEVVKVTTTERMTKELRNVQQKENTWLKAETYFRRLTKLDHTGIDVSRVIGAYVPSQVIGPYTPESAAKAGIDYAPEKSAYAGKENPAGQRFQGIVRWSTPVRKNGALVGYVTLALDHNHIMEFTDHIVPTDERYTNISDAGSGNYAFLWDFEGRNISHPRDYFIVGYDPKTGEEAVPWLSKEIYDAWQATGLSFNEYQKHAPIYKDQSRNKKPSLELKKRGSVALDCRYLNFAPQCMGWRNITQNGGSGSFLIFWSGLWKLSTAATVPYFTGQYGNSPRGFGWVTIGANVEEFHRPALETKASIDIKILESDQRLLSLNQSLLELILDNAKKLLAELSVSTLIMLVLVMLIAIWLATTLARRVSQLNRGLTNFQNGDLNTRLELKSKDEFGQLTKSFNTMADRIQSGFQDLNSEIEERRLAEKRLEQAQDELEDRVAVRTEELSASNDRLKEEIVQHGLTEQSRIEAERIKNDAQQRLADAVEVLPSAFALFDAEDKLVLYNAEYERIFGEYKGALKIGDDYKNVLRQFAEKLEGKHKPENMEEYLNARLMRRGHPARNMIFQYEPDHWIEVNDYLLDNGAVIFVGIDVSERRRLESQLGHSQKMDAVGQLTGGIAHDFNNILGIVMGNLELIEEDVKHDKETLPLAQAALKGVRRGAEITKKLLRFSSTRVAGTKLILLNEFLAGMEDLVAKCLTASIQLEIKLTDDLWPVDIDPGEFEDAVINLALNARDAMKNEGSLIIETANKSLDDSYLESFPSAKTGDYVMISIRDTGVGMADDVKEKVFEPFFTTKKDGQGTGLGLSMVYGFVQRSGGQVDIHSKEGAGTTFNIYLPRAKTSKIEERFEEKQSRHMPLGSETVLVVDDEIALANVTIASLQQLGYKTFSANSGREALGILEKHPEIDLLFSDVVMPGELDGYQLALAAHKKYPDLSVLLTSGFTKQREASLPGKDEFSRRLISDVLNKPYNRLEMAVAVRRTLDEKNAALV